MVGSVKNKQQKIKFINGRWCDDINVTYLSHGWEIVSIHPVASKDEIGAYVILEKEELAAPVKPIEYLEYS
jgi:hypothetical protein